MRLWLGCRASIWGHRGYDVQGDYVVCADVTDARIVLMRSFGRLSAVRGDDGGTYYYHSAEDAEADRDGSSAVAVADCDLGWTDLVRIMDGYEWGAHVTDVEHTAACARMEAYLTDHEGPLVSIRVRPARAGEVEGLYLLQGESLSRVHETDDLYAACRDVTGAAWQHACETWPQVQRS